MERNFVLGKTFWGIIFLLCIFNVGKREHQRNENESERKRGLYYYIYSRHSSDLYKDLTEIILKTSHTFILFSDPLNSMF